MDPIQTYPIILNATLNQQPQAFWTSNTIPMLITSGFTILGVYLGHKWAKDTETERNLIKLRRQAYYKYIDTFSEAAKIDTWTPLLISEKLPVLWRVALEAGEYGNINGERMKIPIDHILNVKGTGTITIPANLKDALVFGRYCKVNISKESLEQSYFQFASLHGFIEFLEIIMHNDAGKIKMEAIVEMGESLNSIFRGILLKRLHKTPWWMFWVEKNDLVMYEDYTKMH